MIYIAIDIAIIPTKYIIDTAIYLNKKLLKTTKEKYIELNKYDCFPHVSLSMGIINKLDLDIISKKIQKITNEFLPITLETTKIKNGKSFLLKIIGIKKTKELSLLHEKIMIELKPHFYNKIDHNLLDNPYKISLHSLNTIINYKKIISFNRYAPHITLGKGNINIRLKPTKFNTTKIAIFQMGDHCTCRKIIASFNAKEKLYK